MRFGLTLAPHMSGAAPALLDDAIQTAVTAEDAGIHTIYVPERHVDAGAGYANAFAVAAAISAHVQHAWLGVAPAIGLDHPLRLVEQSNLLDVLTRGRCLVVVADDLDPQQYAAFGVPAPSDGLFDELVDRMLDGWSWQYVEDGPPLEFRTGPYTTRMAGRVMPAACRQPHPLLARESGTQEGVWDAALRGWPIQLRGVDAEQAVQLIARYREALAASGHAQSTIEECGRWLVVALDITRGALDGDLARSIGALRDAGVAEVRLEPAPGVALERLIRDVAGSA